MLGVHLIFFLFQLCSGQAAEASFLCEAVPICQRYCLQGQAVSIHWLLVAGCWRGRLIYCCLAPCKFMLPVQGARGQWELQLREEDSLVVHPLVGVTPGRCPLV